MITSIPCRAIMFAACVSMLTILLWIVSPSVNAHVPLEISTENGIGYQLEGGIVFQSSPKLADLTNDGIPEIVLGTTMENGINFLHDRPTSLVAMRGNGTILWEKILDSPINSSAAIGDINDDGSPEILIGMGGDVGNLDHMGKVAAFSATGTVLWEYFTYDYYPADGFTDGVYSSPGICELDGDPQKEIVFGSWDQRIYAVDHLGNSIWVNVNWQGNGYFNADSVWSSPSCVDLNGDNIDEVIIGADIALDQSGNGQEGGFLYVFSANGQPLVRRYLPETIFSSPAIADLDGDGTIEIAVGTGDFYYYAHGQVDQPYVYVFETENIFSGMAFNDPNKLPFSPGWPQATVYPGLASPSLADLDGDGDIEIVVYRHKRGGGAPYACNNGSGECFSALYAWHHDGQLVAGFPMWPRDFLGKNAASVASTTIANIDNDPAPEILVSMLWDVIAIGNNGQTKQHFTTQWMTSSAPAVGDTDGNGTLDLWIGSGSLNNPAHGYLWTFPLTGTAQSTLPWPQFRRDSYNSGVFDLMNGDLFPFVHVPIHDPTQGSMASGELYMNNSESLTTYGWSIEGLPSSVSTAHTSGTIPGGVALSVGLTINTAGLPDGLHNIGEMTVNSCLGPCPGTILQSTNVSIMVGIGDIPQTFLPIMAP